MVVLDGPGWPAWLGLISPRPESSCFARCRVGKPQPQIPILRGRSGFPITLGVTPASGRKLGDRTGPIVPHGPIGTDAGAALPARRAVVGNFLRKNERAESAMAIFAVAIGRHGPRHAGAHSMPELEGAVGGNLAGKLVVSGAVPVRRWVFSVQWSRCDLRNTAAAASIGSCWLRIPPRSIPLLPNKSVVKNNRAITINRRLRPDCPARGRR